MPSVCILTDSSAQFTQTNYPGQERVHVIPFDLENTAIPVGDSFPGRVLFHRRLISPSPQEFIRFYERLGREFDSILVLTLSSFLHPLIKNALSAAGQKRNGVAVEVVDSQTTALGLGMLVQLAAGAASKGASLKELDLQLRASIPRVYMLFCIPELTYLALSGLMDHAQAMVAEMMGMLPIFAFEEGRMVPMEKVRTLRHLFEAFQDFMGEFESPSQIALQHCSGRGSLRTDSLRQFVQATFPRTLFSEHPVQPHLAALLGPQSIGMYVMESQ
jgi:DegV family protein with EDD domain